MSGERRPEAAERGAGQLRGPWDWLMFVLASGSLAIIGWVEYHDLAWADPSFQVLAGIDLAIVLAFSLELIVRFVRSSDRWGFVRANWYDLPGLVPLYAEAFSWLR